MIAGYLKLGLNEMDYRAWKRLNTTPYISDQHGSRIVNVYPTTNQVISSRPALISLCRSAVS